MPGTHCRNVGVVQLVAVVAVLDRLVAQSTVGSAEFQVVQPAVGTCHKALVVNPPARREGREKSKAAILRKARSTVIAAVGFQQVAVVVVVGHAVKHAAQSHVRLAAQRPLYARRGVQIGYQRRNERASLSIDRAIAASLLVIADHRRQVVLTRVLQRVLRISVYYVILIVTTTVLYPVVAAESVAERTFGQQVGVHDFDLALHVLVHLVKEVVGEIPLDHQAGKRRKRGPLRQPNIVSRESLAAPIL